MTLKVSVIGLGYVGFPLACAIAKNSEYDVYGIDLDERKIENIKNKISPIEDFQAQKDIKEVNINVSNNFKEVENSNFIIIAVPTPVLDNKLPDLTPVKKAIKEILPYLKKDQIIILESTVNPGVCEEIVLPILESTGLKGSVDFDLIHCPERIDPGNSKYNVYNIARNIGGTSLEGTKKAAEFYRSFIKAEINEMSSLKVVEATKILENTFRDINIAYVNELAKSFDIMGIDITEVINGASNKPFAFLAHYPGCGVGGHCIPVDPYYLIEKAKSVGFEHKFLINAREINESMPEYTVERLIKGLKELNLEINKVGLLGLSYKANVDDLRESPAIKIKEELEKLNFEVFVCDPYIKETLSLNEVLTKTQVIILATNHREFLEITNWENIKLIIDGRNCLDKEKIKQKGIKYLGIGRN